MPLDILYVQLLRKAIVSAGGQVHITKPYHRWVLSKMIQPISLESSSADMITVPLRQYTVRRRQHESFRDQRSATAPVVTAGPVAPAQHRHMGELGIVDLDPAENGRLVDLHPPIVKARVAVRQVRPLVVVLGNPPTEVHVRTVHRQLILQVG